MRFKLSPKPVDGEHRVFRKFAWFPKELDDSLTLVWFERCNVLCRWNGVTWHPRVYFDKSTEYRRINTTNSGSMMFSDNTPVGEIITVYRYSRDRFFTIDKNNREVPAYLGDYEEVNQHKEFDQALDKLLK